MNRDQLQVTIYGFQLFADVRGNFFLPPTVLSPKDLPTMIAAAQMEEAQGVADTAKNALNAGMLANTIVMFVVAGPMQQLLNSVK